LPAEARRAAPHPLKVGFAGTPAFAAAALSAILAHGFDVRLVLTQPDRPKGRGMRPEASPVRRMADEHGIPVQTPPSLKSEEARAPVVAVPLDVLVVAAYGLILPPGVLAWPKHGCINIHASRLPRWRGAAPIPRAIAAGDGSTGVSIMQMDAGLDTGPVIELAEVAIDARETAGTLHDKLATAGAAAIVRVLQRLAHEGALTSTPQPPVGATYAAKLDRAEAAVDWTLPAGAIDRAIRAFDPVPGAFTTIDGQVVKVWQAQPLEMTGDGSAPGTVLSAGKAGIDVACGTGALRVLEVQPAAGRRMSAAAFALGHGIRPGSRCAGVVRTGGT
jgi:methionyl-tRNA formyltransferase